MLYPVLARDPAFSHIFLFGPVPELLAPNTFYISSLGQLSNPPVTHLKFCGGGGMLPPSCTYTEQPVEFSFLHTVLLHASYELTAF